MLHALLHNTEFSQMLTFVSPAFFKVLSPGDLLAQTGELLRNYRDKETFQRTIEGVRDELTRSMPPIILGQKLTAGEGMPLQDCPAEFRALIAERILIFYFRQIFAQDATILDLRLSTFSGDVATQSIHWSPRPICVRWDPAFLSNLRQLYRGFYDDDMQVFQAATRELNLTPAEDALRQHFGANREQVAFQMRTFVASFEHIFALCERNATRLHRNFLPLGFYLAALYETLEALGCPLNVKALFHKAIAG